MEWLSWLSLAGICALGAMSPGPSLLIVLRNAAAGPLQGSICALSHGIAIGLYALLTALGLALVVTQTPALFQGLQWAGALLLVYIGWQALTSPAGPAPASQAAKPQSPLAAASQGFSIALFNPKVALFFGALFSQFVHEDQSLAVKLAMAGVAASIDTLWYLLVTFAVTTGHKRGINLGPWGQWLQKLFGAILLALAARLAWSLL
ncbi:LysE family translocator [uncultured Microbulbifer sp.]|uniref:LysE family translocator n=1 Tax=uncultured Microbulbifer sp. TaxID=348147 RepID=UPI0025DEE7E4|nr:LysE family translocator [uncultured Microbulbifer sp.]